MDKKDIKGSDIKIISGESAKTSDNELILDQAKSDYYLYCDESELREEINTLKKENKSLKEEIKLLNAKLDEI